MEINRGKRREVAYDARIFILSLSPSTSLSKLIISPDFETSPFVLFPPFRNTTKSYAIAKGTLASLILDAVCPVSLRGWRTQMGCVCHQRWMLAVESDSQGRFTSRKFWFSEKFYKSRILISGNE